MKRCSFVLSLLAVLIALAIPASSAAATEFALELSLAGSGEGAVSCKVGAGSFEECEAEYPEGSALTLLAEPEWGSEFSGWEGECDTTSGPECKVTINADKEIEARFDLEEFEVTLQSEGSGEGVLECQVNGGPTEPCPEAESYPWETELTVFAEAEEGSEFAEWEGDCSGIEAECVLIVEEELQATAIFVPEPPFELAISTAGTGEGEVLCALEGGEAEPCEAEYEEGTEVTLLPEAEEGSEFIGWSGDCTGAGPCELTMDEDREVTATFELEPEEFTLAVSKAGSGQGTVSSSPAGISCGSTCAAPFEEGAEVTLTATPASGSAFSGWSGACTGTGACKVTMTEARAVSATFSAESSPPPPPPPPPPGEGIAKVASVAKVKGGKAQLKLTCSGEGACKGSLKLTAKLKSGGKTKPLVIAKGSFSLARGAKATLRLKLSGPAKQALAKGPLKARVKGTGVAASSVKLKA